MDTGRAADRGVDPELQQTDPGAACVRTVTADREFGALDVEWGVGPVGKRFVAVIWGKVHKWITTDEFIQLRSEYFDEDGELVKSDFAYDFKVMDGRLIPTRIEIVPADEEGKKTVLYITDIQFDIDLPESFFSQQNMKRIR